MFGRAAEFRFDSAPLKFWTFEFYETKEMAGRVTVKVVPTLGVLVTTIRPRCARTMASTRVNPKPVPGRERLRSQR